MTVKNTPRWKTVGPKPRRDPPWRESFLPLSSEGEERVIRFDSWRGSFAGSSDVVFPPAYTQDRERLSDDANFPR